MKQTIEVDVVGVLALMGIAVDREDFEALVHRVVFINKCKCFPENREGTDEA